MKDNTDRLAFIDELERRLKESDDDDTIDTLEVKAEMAEWFNEK